MSLNRLPLRLKLIAALLLPLAVVAGYLGVRVNDALDRRQVASAQEEEVWRFDAVLDFADAIGRENRAINDFTLGNDALAEARRDGDEAWQRLSSPEFGMSADRLATLADHRNSLLELRAALGNDVGEIIAVVQAEIAAGNTEEGSYLLETYVPMGTLAGIVLGSYDFDESAIASTETERLLIDYSLVERLRAAIGIEASTYAGLASLDAATMTADVTEFVATTISDSEAAVAVLTDLGQPEQVALLDEFLASEQFAPFLELRETSNDLTIGSDPGVNAFAVQTAALNVDTALSDISSFVAGQVEAEAAAATVEANDQLLRSALVGGGLLLLVAVILTLLFRAIRQPLRRLTEQSQQIAEVELPEIVRAMRSGEMTTMPTVEEIEAPSDDEVGELVMAFNGMHRTAVELAAEQAGSRRVVADMFVNLGRRNQKLLNRMLKGLTQLEQEEQNPDTLEALFKIDQLATRMRRNAESLLILAGASQARTWKTSIPAYDVVQAALSEVENFQRVRVDVSDHELVRGDHVADLAHLIAELTENALTFSPPTTEVEIMSRHTQRGFVIAITDMGVGMAPDKLAETNDRIANAADQDETPSKFLGLYVVGRLAARRGFTVDLLETAAGGTTARIVLPPTALDTDVEQAAPTTPMSDHRALDEVDALLASIELSAELEPSSSAPTADDASAPRPPLAAAPTVSPLPQRRPGASVLGSTAPTDAPVVPAPGGSFAPPSPPARVPDAELSLSASPLAPPSVPAPVGRFGAVRRPGANMPSSPITIDRQPEAGECDPDDVRTSLAGFQAGTSRADEEVPR